MQDFRKFVKGPLGVTLLVVFTVPFIASGFYGYFTSSGSSDSLATVEGSAISSSAVSQRVQMMREQVRRQSPNVDPDMIEQFISPAMVLNSMVNNALLAEFAAGADMYVSEQQAGTIINQVPAFKGDDGKFDAALFEQFTRNQGMTPKQWVGDLRRDMVMAQVKNGFELTAFSLERELQEERRLGEQTRDITWLVKPVSDLVDQQTVTDEAVAAYYEQNADDFMIPERFRLAYLMLDPAAYRDDVTVTDEQVQEEYAARVAALETVAQQDQRRMAAHVMVSVGDNRSEAEAQQRIADAQAKLDAGASFADVAAEYSDDPVSARDGGKLGWLRKGDLPESLDQAVFALEPGQVSGVLSSDSGLHLVKLLEIEDREIPSLDDMREAIVTDLKQRNTDIRMNEDLAVLEELAFEHPDLQQPAESLGLEVQRTDWFSASAPKGVATLPGVLDAMMQPEIREDGLNSTAIELPGSRFLVFRIAETQAAELRPLADVRGAIVAALKREQALAELDQMMEQALAATADGAGLDSLAEQWGSAIESAADVRRQSSEPSIELVRNAFDVARVDAGDDGAIQVSRLANGDLAAFRVTAITDGGAEPLAAPQQAMALAELTRTQGQRSVRQTVAFLRDSFDVEINEARLKAQMEDAQ
jgi:peptidyl-prolyl cis-trans isomerase D